MISAACGQQGQAQTQDRSDVLCNAIDDLNDWIGCPDGHPDALTPKVVRLAKCGVFFTNAHCAAPACNPSRAAVCSGLLAIKTEAGDGEDGRTENAGWHPHFGPVSGEKVREIHIGK